MPTDSLVKIKNLVKHFDISGGLLDQLQMENGRITRKQTVVKAVNNVSFEIKKGETLSVVGESGCGKSTLARTVMGLYPPNSGEVHYDGERIDNLPHAQMLPYRTKMQMVFQDPYASLNPRMTVRQIIEEPIYFHNKGISRGEAKDKLHNVMRSVGMDPEWAGNYPMNSPVVSASASALPALWLSNLNSSWPMNPSPRWTFPFRPRF